MAESGSMSAAMKKKAACYRRKQCGVINREILAQRWRHARRITGNELQLS
jgi:hypothetical protein